jgi:hypothetical protein
MKAINSIYALFVFIFFDLNMVYFTPQSRLGWDISPENQGRALGYPAASLEVLFD